MNVYTARESYLDGPLHWTLAGKAAQYVVKKYRLQIDRSRWNPESAPYQRLWASKPPCLKSSVSTHKLAVLASVLRFSMAL